MVDLNATSSWMLINIVIFVNASMYRLYIDLGVQKTSIMWEQFLILTGVMHLLNPASSAGPDKNEN